jgi:hypothetical protein
MPGSNLLYKDCIQLHDLNRRGMTLLRAKSKLTKGVTAHTEHLTLVCAEERVEYAACDICGTA